MIKKLKVLALIPARGGSKGIKNKNITEIGGKPLIAYTIEAAKNSKYVDEVVVTTDSVEIARISKLFGASVPFLRPENLASDTSKTIDAVIHAKEMLKKQGKEYDILVLLQATSPLRTYEDLDGALERFCYRDMKSLAAVSKVADNPMLIRTIEDDGKLKKLLNVNSTCRRQDMPTYYKVNGSIYINKMDEISESTSFNDNEISYIIESTHAIDIDSYIDLEIAKYLLNK